MKNILLGAVLAFSCCTQAAPERLTPTTPVKTAVQKAEDWAKRHPNAVGIPLNTLESPLRNPDIRIPR